MQFGCSLHPDRGLDAVVEEARAIERLGFDSVWMSDHLMDSYGRAHTPDGPHDTLLLGAHIGAATSRVKISWGVLSLGFRKPALLAKSLATLDHMTRGRIICTFGAGWFTPEFGAYDLFFPADHDERIAYARECLDLVKTLWTHPAPELVTYEGKFVHTRDLPFNPAPYQKPHPPIWWGGESDASIAVAKELADGVDLHFGGTKAKIAALKASPDWPNRPMTISRTVRVFVNENRQVAFDEARALHEKGGGHVNAKTFDEYLLRGVVGTPDDCIKGLREMESWGVNHVRLACESMAGLEMMARDVMPQLRT